MARFQQLYWSHTQKLCQGSCCFMVCTILHGLIWQDGLNMCHQCGFQYMKDIGFVKLD
ncbi:40S ribosomal protein S29-like [Mus pahari]|uniref:40S ribosomal protein S29-like n=1 Tax=Mus pahari TaxID=10093 RepID=UPI000A30A78E|nr:40S ribosomal protein S29-like [Mus pahari]